MVSLRPMLPFTSLALCLVTLSGCIVSDDLSPDLRPVDGATPIVPAEAVEAFWHNPIQDGPGHDHAALSDHGSAIQIEQLGFAGPDEETGGSGFFEIDIVGNHVYQCASFGVRILDIQVRDDPTQVGVFENGGCSDVKVTDDGALAIVGGNKLVDVRDKTEPTLIDEYERGCHMCFIHNIGGVDHVFLAQSLGSDASESPNPFQGVIEILRIDRADPLEDSVLTPVSAWTSAPLDIATSTRIPDANPYETSIHDMYVYDDPVLGAPIMVVAHWDQGVYFVDVTDPAAPVNLGHWDDFKGDCGDIHTVAVDFIDGRRILAAATENGIIIDPLCSLNRWSVGFVYIIDATDLSGMTTLGKWHVPGATLPTGHATEPFPRSDDPAAIVGLYSAHNIQFVNGFVYEAMYHGGIFVLDIAGFLENGPATQVDILTRSDHVPTVGHFEPSCQGGGPNVWDVFPKDGYLYASDIDCGLFVLRFLGEDLNDPARTGSA